jgi:hypothetical protein
VYDVKSASQPDIGKQLLFANDRSRVRGAVLGLSQDGARTDLFQNLSVNSLKRDLSDVTTFKPTLFSLVNTFKDQTNSKEHCTNSYSPFLIEKNQNKDGLEMETVEKKS